MKKSFFLGLAVFALMAAAPRVWAQEYVSDQQDIPVVSDRFGADGPLSVTYYASTGRVVLRVDTEAYPDLTTASDIPYPQIAFVYTVERDGQFVSNDGERYTTHSFDAVDGDYAVDFANRTLDGSQQIEWYDRISFTINQDDFADIAPENYQVTVNHIIQDVSGVHASYPVTYRNGSYSGGSLQNTVSVDDSNTATFVSQEYRGFTAYRPSANLLQTIDEDERFALQSNGWKLESVSGENCAADGTYTTGPGLTTICDMTYSYTYPYPGVITDNTRDQNLVQTIIVDGGDRTAVGIYDDMNQFHKVSGTVLNTDDLDDQDAYRVSGRITSGCGRTGCSHNGDTGVINMPDFSDYSISVSGTNCSVDGYVTGEGIGLTECVFTYTHESEGVSIDEPEISLAFEIIGGSIAI